MTLRLFNTLTGEMDLLTPADGEVLRMYACGPTVYDYGHIGNFRTFLQVDVLRRFLKLTGTKVRHVMNITDVDDKTIAESMKEGVSLKEYTERYTKAFLEDLVALNIEPVEHLPKATESIDAIDDIINRLDEKGLVYEQDGSLYFSIAKFKNYGRLSRLDTREIKSGVRYDADEYVKDDLRDFALWKAVKNENEPSWVIKKGKGRPGWHIECSAMVRKIFGTTIDIHTGGVDLIFPHHENEIAQSEAAYGEKFVRYWLHWEHLLSEGTKMSKSIGNFYTLRDLVEKGYAARAIRHLLMSAHYRKQLNFTLEGITASAHALEKIDNFVARISGLPEKSSHSGDCDAAINRFVAAFTESMDDDLNISGAIGKLFEFVREINSLIDGGSLSRNDGTRILETLRSIDSVLGLIFFPGSKEKDPDASRIEKLIEERKQAKANRDFAAADRIRNDLLSEGIILEDGKEGTTWKRKH